jgi:hypothetical protein
VNGLAVQFHLPEPLDLLHHILPSQLACARFGLALYMPFIDSLEATFVVSAFCHTFDPFIYSDSVGRRFFFLSTPSGRIGVNAVR